MFDDIIVFLISIRMRYTEHLYIFICLQRKIASNKTPAGMPVGTTNFVPAALNTEKINSVMNEVTHIKDKQEDMDGKLDTMKTENEALWREVVSLRQKHLSQQKIVNKLIQFLVSLVSQPRRMQGGITATGSGDLPPALKRRFTPQLAIEGATQAKERRMQEASDIHQSSNAIYGSRSGPIIHEVLPNEGEEEGFGNKTTVTQPISGMKRSWLLNWDYIYIKMVRLCMALNL